MCSDRLKLTKFKAVFVIFSLFVLFSPVLSTYAAQTELEKQTQAFAGSQGAGLPQPRDPRIVVASVVRYAISFVGVLFLAYIVYAGYIIMTAAGNDEQVNKGKTTLRNSVLGVLIAMSAYAITVFISQALLGATKEESGGFNFGINQQQQQQYRYEQNPGGTQNAPSEPGTFIPNF